MEVGYEGILENGQMSEGAVPRPHAQVHLLSPTDKCKVRQIFSIIKQNIFQKTDRNIFDSLKLYYFLNLIFFRFAMNLPPSMSTTEPWLASVAEHSSGDPFRTRQPPPTCVDDPATARSSWVRGKTVNIAGECQVYSTRHCACHMSACCQPQVHQTNYFRHASKSRHK